MKEVKRDQYIFVGPKAQDSAYYYQSVRDRGRVNDIVWLVWESAHKFGSRVIGPGFVSFCHGLMYGSNAKEAAEFFDEKWKTAFAQCQTFQRRKSMGRVSQELLETIESEYNVDIVVYDQYYY